MTTSAEHLIREGYLLEPLLPRSLEDVEAALRDTVVPEYNTLSITQLLEGMAVDSGTFDFLHTAYLDMLGKIESGRIYCSANEDIADIAMRFGALDKDLRSYAVMDKIFEAVSEKQTTEYHFDAVEKIQPSDKCREYIAKNARILLLEAIAEGDESSIGYSRIFNRLEKDNDDLYVRQAIAAINAIVMMENHGKDFSFLSTDDLKDLVNLTEEIKWRTGTQGEHPLQASIREALGIRYCHFIQAGDTTRKWFCEIIAGSMGYEKKVDEPRTVASAVKKDLRTIGDSPEDKNAEVSLLTNQEFNDSRRIFEAIAAQEDDEGFQQFLAQLSAEERLGLDTLPPSLQRGSVLAELHDLYKEIVSKVEITDRQSIRHNTVVLAGQNKSSVTQPVSIPDVRKYRFKARRKKLTTMEGLTQLSRAVLGMISNEEIVEGLAERTRIRNAAIEAAARGTPMDTSLRDVVRIAKGNVSDGIVTIRRGVRQ